MTCLPPCLLTPVTALCLTVGFVLATSAAGHAADTRPNFVYIIADDLGYGDVGFNGATAIKTPNLDRLASQGLRANDANASSSVCTPTRYAILTGRNYWRRKTDWQGEMLVEPDRPTVAKTLRDAGYATAYFGKWHLGWGNVDPAKPRKLRTDWDWNAPVLKPGVIETGYDTFFGTPFSANEPPLVFVHDRTVVDRDPADPIRMVSPEIEKYFGYGTSKDAKAAHAARPLDHIDLITSQKTADYILAHDKSRPFYLHLALVAPHVPVAPSKEFKGRTKVGPYGDFIEQMDVCVGKILDAIDKAGIADNTVVIFTSDNGAILTPEVRSRGHLSNGKLLGQKTDAWEGGVRVPYVVRWPGKIKAGSVTDRLISLNDFYATACTIVGVALPPGAAPDSLNQLPVLLDPTSPAVRTEMTYNAIIVPQIALRSGEWVYIPGQGSLGVSTAENMAWAMQFDECKFQNSDFQANGKLKSDAPKEQLYNLTEDPDQHINLANKYPERVSELAQRLKAIRSNKAGL